MLRNRSDKARTLRFLWTFTGMIWCSMTKCPILNLIVLRTCWRDQVHSKWVNSHNTSMVGLNLQGNQPVIDPILKKLICLVRHWCNSEEVRFSGGLKTIQMEEDSELRFSGGYYDSNPMMEDEMDKEGLYRSHKWIFICVICSNISPLVEISIQPSLAILSPACAF